MTTKRQVREATERWGTTCLIPGEGLYVPLATIERLAEASNRVVRSWIDHADTADRDMRPAIQDLVRLLPDLRS